MHQSIEWFVRRVTFAKRDVDRLHDRDELRRAQKRRCVSVGARSIVRLGPADPGREAGNPFRRSVQRTNPCKGELAYRNPRIDHLGVFERIGHQSEASGVS